MCLHTSSLVSAGILRLLTSEAVGLGHTEFQDLKLSEGEVLRLVAHTFTWVDLIVVGIQPPIAFYHPSDALRILLTLDWQEF